jgi:hypothetical protein
MLPPEDAPDQDQHEARIRGPQGGQQTRIRASMKLPGSQLLLQLMILQEQPSQPPLQAGAGRNTVLYTKKKTD